MQNITERAIKNENFKIFEKDDCLTRITERDQLLARHIRSFLTNFKIRFEASDSVFFKKVHDEHKAGGITLKIGCNSCLSR